MPFKTLYTRRQKEAEWLPLQWYVDDAKELSWVDDCMQIKRTKALPRSHLRGMVIQHNPGLMPHALTCEYTVFVAHGLTREYERLVVIKELMHLYFGPNAGSIYATDSQIALENHMQEMFAASADIRSHQVEAEKRALWMAISVLTPEVDRMEFQAKVETSKLSVEAVAAKLRVPVHTTKALLSRHYDQEISNLLE